MTTANTLDTAHNQYGRLGNPDKWVPDGWRIVKVYRGIITIKPEMEG